jgi:predicted lactoylglutathione lyase
MLKGLIFCKQSYINLQLCDCEAGVSFYDELSVEQNKDVI